MYATNYFTERQYIIPTVEADPFFRRTVPVESLLSESDMLLTLLLDWTPEALSLSSCRNKQVNNSYAKSCSPVKRDVN